MFTSWGVETPKKFTEEEVRKALGEFDEDASYGTILRAKGFVDSTDGQWIYFDYPARRTSAAAALPSPAVCASSARR